jgi:DNA (cytosine-5)-methyltransferase 1
MTAYYSEHDEFAAQWLRNLIAAGHIAPGDVDTRDLWDVRPDEIAHYTQVHLCAGIAIWSHSLRRAGWADDRPIWTGSFPCQPFSAAGKKLGVADERHLWPAGFHLIRECAPDIVLGEQVASPDGLGWLEGLQADMESAGYAVGAVDTCAAGFADQEANEGFHIRQRIYWGAKRLGHTDYAGPQGRGVSGHGADKRPAWETGVAGWLGHSESHGRGWWSDDHNEGRGERAPRQTGAVDWLPCRDGKYRPVEGGTFPLAHEDPGRVGRLRAYGNALDARQAEGFVRAWMAACP